MLAAGKQEDKILARTHAPGATSKTKPGGPKNGTQPAPLNRQAGSLRYATPRTRRGTLPFIARRPGIAPGSEFVLIRASGIPFSLVIQPSSPAHGRPTFFLLLGFLAIVFWSTSFPIFTKILNPSIGGLRAGAISFALAGILGLGIQARRRGGLGWLRELPRPYFLICGPLFSVFALAMFLAINLSAGPQQSIEITLINYLWIPLIFLFSIPVLGQRARPALILGILIATTGVFLASAREQFIQAGGFDVTSFPRFFANVAHHLRENPWPYPVALLNAICWAAYTVLSRKLLRPEQHDALPLFMLVAGLVLLPIAHALPHPSHWSWAVVGALIYAAIFPSLIAYSLWDLAVRRSDLNLLTAASYATPLLATLANCVLHQTPMTTVLFAACALVIGGAAICKFSIRSASCS